MNRPLLERPRFHALLAAAFAFASQAGCAGPPVPTSLDDEPICPDYEVGTVRTKMQGSLRHPVMLTILDGSTVILKVMVLGRRTDKDTSTRILLTDSNDEYTAQWAQCENERAPRPVTGGAGSKEPLRYECGKEEVYSTGSIVTKKGDLSTHAIKYVPPPKAECWASDVPAPSALEADAGADAAAAAATDTDAGADAGAETDAAADAATEADAAADAATGADAAADAAAPAGDAGAGAGAAKDKKKAPAK